MPELAASFECPPSFRVFGCQNPLQQGGGRKGLPKSFLNRFTQVATLPPLQGYRTQCGFSPVGDVVARVRCGHVSHTSKGIEPSEGSVPPVVR